MHYSVEEYLNDAGNKLGLYHYNCHCEEIEIPQPQESDIGFVIPEGKKKWVLTDKKNWIEALGYKADESFIEYMRKKAAEYYCFGKYKVYQHNQYGFNINMFIDIEGQGEHAKYIYKIRSGWIIFSNGRLKCNTFIAGKEEKKRLIINI